MASPTRRKVYRWLFVGVGILLLAALGDLILSRYIEDKVYKRLAKLNAKATTVTVSLLSRRLLIKELEWSGDIDKASLYPRKVFSKQVTIQHIRWVPLLFKRKLEVGHLTFDEGLIEFNMRVRRNPTKESDSCYASFSFRTISLTNIKAHVVLDTTNTAAEIVHLKVRDSLQNTFYSIYVSDAMATKIRIDWPDEMYSGTIERVRAMSKGGRLIADSILLIPTVEKYEFAKQARRQVPRINLSVPQLTVNRIRLQEIFSNSLIISNIHIESFDLFAFKDKRLPFIQVKDKPLPMESFLKIPFAIRIDSITIGKSHITVEEFPESGVSSGTITFNNVEAICTGLDNRVLSNTPVSSELKAWGLFMNNGSVEAVFQLPLNDPAIYKAGGSISRMELAALNPVLENLANMHVKSGYLNSLTFQFDYTEYTSTGVLDIAYEDLRLTGLNKNESSIDQWKTLLMQILMQRNKSKSSTASKAIGVIDIERDRRKWIFNVWWKSIQDGLRSSLMGNINQTSAETDDR